MRIHIRNWHWFDLEAESDADELILRSWEYKRFDTNRIVEKQVGFKMEKDNAQTRHPADR